MAQKPINDNINISAPKLLDDRQGKIVAGQQLAYETKEEASEKTAGRRPIGLKSYIDVEVLEGINRTLEHRWNGTDWVVDDAVLAREQALIAHRIKASRYPLKDLMDAMIKDRISLNKHVESLRPEMAKYYQNEKFLNCKNMGEILKLSLKVLVKTLNKA